MSFINLPAGLLARFTRLYFIAIVKTGENDLCVILDISPVHARLPIKYFISAFGSRATGKSWAEHTARVKRNVSIQNVPPVNLDKLKQSIIK